MTRSREYGSSRVSGTEASRNLSKDQGSPDILSHLEIGGDKRISRHLSGAAKIHWGKCKCAAEENSVAQWAIRSALRKLCNRSGRRYKRVRLDHRGRNRPGRPATDCRSTKTAWGMILKRAADATYYRPSYSSTFCHVTVTLLSGFTGGLLSFRYQFFPSSYETIGLPVVLTAVRTLCFCASAS
jgi:hypothetical protein